MHCLSRRSFVFRVAAAVPVLAMPQPLFGASAETRVLSFTHLHTGERLEAEYFAGGAYQLDAVSAINHLLRDFRTDDVHVIDQNLLDLLHGLSTVTGTRQPYQVISGYRSPATNRMLRQHSDGVAAHSLHMEGQAIDIRLADVPLGHLREAALSIRRGGVGYYPASNFVHVDTGRVRTW